MIILLLKLSEVRSKGSEMCKISYALYWQITATFAMILKFQAFMAAKIYGANLSY